MRIVWLPQVELGGSPANTSQALAVVAWMLRSLHYKAWRAHLVARVSPLEAVRDANDDRVGPRDEGPLEGYCRLVVQDALPEVAGYKLRQHHHDGLAGGRAVQGVDVGENGGDEGAVRRLDDHKRHLGDRLLPCLTHVLGLLHVVADVESRDVLGDGSGVLDGPADGPLPLVHGHQHRPGAVGA